MVDWPVVGALSATVVTTTGTVIIGVITGRNSRSRDKDRQKFALEKLRHETEMAEENASKGRIEALAEDLNGMRKLLRESEANFYRELRLAHLNGQRGWDLARHHFSLLCVVSHLLNNILLMESLDSPITTDAVRLERFRAVARNSILRMSTIRIPTSLEEPIPPSAEELKGIQ